MRRAVAARLILGAAMMVGAVAAVPPPAVAHGPAVLTGISAEAFRQAMSDWGLPTALTVLEDGTPVIDSAAGAQAFSVLFFNCATGDVAPEQAFCRDLQFRAGFARTEPPDLATLNAWNRDRRFSRAYLFAERYAYLEMDLRLDGGVTEANLRSAAATFTALMADFARHIGG